MLNVLVTMRFDRGQLDRLRAVSPEIRVSQADPEAADYSTTDVLYAGSPPRDLARAPALRWVQLHMAGVNALADHPLYTKTTLPLTTTSGVHAATIAEYAMTMLLALAHRVPRMVEWQGRGGWPPDEQRWPLFVPAEVRGATLGIIGYGSIGRELARIAKSAFSMTVLASKRDPSRRADDGYALPGTGDPEGLLPDEWLGPDELDSLLARSDVVVLCAPLTPETRGLIGAKALARMKPSAFFINVGRGASVDEAALADALRERRIAGAAVDVFDREPPPAGHPLYAVDSAIVSPHVSGFLPSYDEKCSVLFAENLRRFLAGAPLLNLVDRARGY
ncbi:MAG TPA: D-2-hydroxyacid dehydrogenase [Methylomirabilota bacterium]|nr:D-2-hydroxyacid dehydrogenase [Methylomirabilota bacterium]